MAFGLLQAPSFFQYMVEDLISKSPLENFSAEGYFDDLTCHHPDSWQRVWRDSVEILRLLSEEGIMVNLKKCKFLVHWLPLLGATVYHGGYQLGDKWLRAWKQVEIPKTLK